MAKSKIPEIILKRYQKMKELSDPVMAQVEINRNLYAGKLIVDDTYEWDYSLVDPHVFPLVRNYLSRSNPTMSSIRLDVRKDKDTEARKVNQDLINWQIGELMTTSLYYRMYYSAYIAGHGYNKTGWKYEKAIEIQDVDKDGNVTRTKIMKDIVNRAESKFVRFNDLLVPNLNITDIHEQPYLLELIQQNVGDMLDENEYNSQNGKKPKWDPNFIKKLRDAGVKSKILSYQIDIVDDSGFSKEDLAFRAAYVPMFCLQTKDGELFYMPIEEHEEIVNTDRSNPYWHNHYPYVDFSPFPEDDNYYNLSLVDVVGDLQIAATEILNQTMTNIRQINNDMWVSGSSAAQTPDWMFRKRPDGVIRVIGDTEQIKQIKTQDNTMPALKMSQEIQNKIERAGGISSLYASGAPSQSINQTARGAQIIDQNIDTNMKMIIDLFGEQVLKKTGEHFLELNSQYITEDQTFSITGKRGVRELVTIKPEETNANFIVSVNTEKIQKQSPASRQASLQNSATILQNIENASGGDVQINITPVVEALIDATPEMDDVDDVITTIDEKSEKDISMLERGQMPTIKVRDAHEDLIIASNVWFEENQENYPEDIKQMFEDYVMKHIKYIQAKQEAQAMSQPILPTSSGGGGALGAEAGIDQGVPAGGGTYNLGNIGGNPNGL